MRKNNTKCPILTVGATAILTGMALANTTDEDWDSLLTFCEWKEEQDRQYRMILDRYEHDKPEIRPYY